MNRDGRNDIAVLGGTWIRIARNSRRGFRASIVARGRAQDMEVGDVNGDRLPDLVTANVKGRLQIYRQRRRRKEGGGGGRSRLGPSSSRPGEGLRAFLWQT